MWFVPPISTLADRVKQALDAEGMAQNALEAEAKLPKGYVSRILKGERKRVGSQLTSRMAKVLKVNHDWLTTGEGPRARTEPTTPLALVHSTPAVQHWTDDQVEDWLVQAIDRERHRGVHVNAARVLLVNLPTMLEPGTTPEEFARRALDAAVVLTARGESLEPQQLLYYMASTKLPPVGDHPDGRSRWDVEGDADLERQGVKPPGSRGPVKPAEHTPKPPSSGAAVTPRPPSSGPKKRD